MQADWYSSLSLPATWRLGACGPNRPHPFVYWSFHKEITSRFSAISFNSETIFSMISLPHLHESPRSLQTSVAMYRIGGIFFFFFFFLSSVAFTLCVSHEGQLQTYGCVDAWVLLSTELCLTVSVFASRVRLVKVGQSLGMNLSLQSTGPGRCAAVCIPDTVTGLHFVTSHPR